LNQRKQEERNTDYTYGIIYDYIGDEGHYYSPVRLLESKRSVFRAVSLPIELGIVPARLLLYSARLVRPDRPPREAGIVPCTLFANIEILVNFGNPKP
jgi:hypothetical protein